MTYYPSNRAKKPVQHGKELPFISNVQDCIFGKFRNQRGRVEFFSLMDSKHTTNDYFSLRWL